MEKQTGISKKDLIINKIKKNESSREFQSLLCNESNNSKKKISSVLEEYLNNTSEKRKNEKEIINKYIQTERSIARDLYEENNSQIIQNLDVKKSDIIFQSKLTSSAIINLTKNDIKTIAKSNNVKSIQYYEQNEQLDPRLERNMTELKMDKLRNSPFNLSGQSVNILQNEINYVRSDVTGYSNIANVDRIKNIYNSHVYSTDNISALPTYPQSDYDHANYVASVLHECAPNTNIYSTRRYQYSDIEYGLLYCNIQIINASTSYGTPNNYDNHPESKWFDAIAKQHNVVIIASAGNYVSDGDTRVLSPACGYNSIAVGVYDINTNKMMNYRYSPIIGDDLPCYKPDVIVPAGDTSTGAPIVSSIVSMLIQCEPLLAGEPEIIKAILMASCHRKVLPYGNEAQENIFDGLTIKQGAGVIDAYKALSIVLQGNYEISVVASNSIESPDIHIGRNNDVNVSMTWFRNNTGTSYVPTIQPSIGDLQELKLEVFANEQLITSSSKTNTYKQMVYFSNNSISENQYKIKVSKTTESTENTQFAYAWSTKDNYITLHTDSSSGILTRSEAASQLSSAGIISGDSSEPFYVDFDDSVSIIGYQAFRWYNNLAGVDLSGITKIENGAFRDCSSLSEVEIPSGLLTIEDNAFRNCSSLSKVIIGDSVRSIGENAFYNCSSLSNVVFLKYIAPTIRDNAFSDIANNAKGYITPLAVGYANSYDDLEIVHNTNIKTIYFTNNKNWNNLYAYVWNGNVSYYNQTIPLQYSYMNHYGQNVYSLTVDTNQYDMVRFIGDNGNHRTVEIEIGANGIEYYTTSGNANNEYNVSTYMPDVRTIYFTNNNNWTDVRAYLWKAGTSQNNIWHGLPMTYSYTNGYSQDVYSINLDYNEYDCVVFNDFNSNNQTVDINIGSSGIGYYLTGNKVGNKWMVGTFYN